MAKVLNPADTIGKWEHVSASQLTTLFFCEQKYAFRYGMRLPDPKTGSLALGTAVDEAAQAHNREKMETHQNKPLAHVQEIAVAKLEAQKDDTKWDPADPFNEIKDEIPGIVKVLWDGSLSQVQPVAVQEEVRVEFDNWHLLGYLDVRGDDGVVRDYKTAKRSWADGKETTEVQPVIYTMHAAGASTFRWDIAVRNKTPKLQQVSRVVTPVAKEGMKRLAAKTKTRADQLRLDPELALPTGYGGWLCSKKLCPFWGACEKRWGQPIKD